MPSIRLAWLRSSETIEIVGRHDRLQQSDIGRVSGSEQQRRLGTRKRGEPLLDAFEYFVVAAQQARAAGSGWKASDGGAHRLRQVRVLGEAEVVVRNEIDPARQPHLPKKTGAAQLAQRGREAIFKLLPRVHA